MTKNILKKSITQITKYFIRSLFMLLFLIVFYIFSFIGAYINHDYIKHCINSIKWFSFTLKIGYWCIKMLRTGERSVLETITSVSRRC